MRVMCRTREELSGVFGILVFLIVNLQLPCIIPFATFPTANIRTHCLFVATHKCIDAALEHMEVVKV